MANLKACLADFMANLRGLLGLYCGLFCGHIIFHT